MEGLLRQVVRQIPPRRPAMELGDLVGVAAAQFFLQKIGEEPVIAEPLPAVVQRHEEQILALQALQHLLAAVLPVTASQSEPHRRSRMLVWSRNRAARFGQTGEHVLAQVIGDEAMPCR